MTEIGTGRIVISLEDKGEMVPIFDRTLNDPNVALNLTTLCKWLIDEAPPAAQGMILGMVSAIRDPEGTREDLKRLPPELREAVKKQMMTLLEAI